MGGSSNASSGSSSTSGSSLPTFAQIEGAHPSTTSADFANKVQQARSCQGQSSSTTTANCQGQANINACSRPRPLHKPGERRPDATASDPYCVGGQPYQNTDAIPGNDPVPLKDATGNPVMGSDGKPVYGPSRGVSQLGGIADKLDGDGYLTPWDRKNDLTNFRKAGPWDFQRMRDDDGSIIFTPKYTEFANIAIGYGDAKHAKDWYPYFGDESTESITEQYLIKHPSKFGNEPMNPSYPHVPIRITRDYQIGRNLRKTLPPKAPK